MFLMKLKVNNEEYYVNFYHEKERLYVKYYNCDMVDITYMLNKKTTKLGFISFKTKESLAQTLTTILYSILYKDEFIPPISIEEFSKSITIL